MTLARFGDAPFADIDVLARMAAAAAVALDHALTLEHAQHRAALMRAVLETAHDAYIALDEDMRVTAWTPQAEALFGYNEQEIMGERVDEVPDPGALAPRLSRRPRAHAGARQRRLGPPVRASRRCTRTGTGCGSSSRRRRSRSATAGW